MKSHRERCVCAAFLRCMGINFQAEDIYPQKHDPPDVIFGSSQFEVKELLDKNRKRTDEFRDRLNVLCAAGSMEDTLIDIKNPHPISLTELFDQIFNELKPKAIKYKNNGYSGLDALVYVCLRNRFLDAKSVFPDSKSFANQGWRSVSFVFPPYACVMWADQDAPAILSCFTGVLRSEWKDPDGLFEIENPS